jgi:hypothetical protein
MDHHPLLSAIRQGGDPLVWTSIHYSLESFPTLEHPDAPYQAKVVLEFLMKSPLNARKFHETLLAGDELVDPSQEIEWGNFNDTYRVSFYLKNRRAS